MLLAELGGEPVGYALVRIVDGFHSFGPDERIASVETLSVLPEARGRGVWSALMDAAERELAEVDVGRLKLAGQVVSSGGSCLVGEAADAHA